MKHFKHQAKLFAKIRKDLKMTQKEFGHHLKTHSQYVSNWERGKCAPAKHAVKRLVKKFNPDGFRHKLAGAMMADYQSDIREFTLEVFDGNHH